MTPDRHLLDATIEALPDRYPGPGGAVAVLHDGAVLVRHAWGFANAEARIAFTPATLFRMCSITKQFTCALGLDMLGDMSVLDQALAARLPNLEQAPPSALHLCHNQSGLRDYWAVAMLLGAPVESAFGDAEAARLIAGTRALHFAPGTQYSYANQNFRLLSDLLEARSGRGFAELLRARLFAPAGMEHAILAADTSVMPDGTTGYEGTPATGFRAAENRIAWTGDAGLGASLDDMIAWERAIDAGRDDPASLYRRLAAPVTFADGTPARYGFGLAREVRRGVAITGHGGALRGWRSHRLHVAQERISVVIMFNHMNDARAAAMDVLDAVMGGSAGPARSASTGDPNWDGAWIEAETHLAVRMASMPDGRIGVRYMSGPEMFEREADGSARSEGARLSDAPGGLVFERPGENRHGRLTRLEGPSPPDISGVYACDARGVDLGDDLGARLDVVSAGGVLHGAFSGAFGQGRMERLTAAGRDVWMLPCPRALDVAPPGDWTLSFERDADGRVAGVRVGCWLARNLVYRRL